MPSLPVVVYSFVCVCVACAVVVNAATWQSHITFKLHILGYGQIFIEPFIHDILLLVISFGWRKKFVSMGKLSMAWEYLNDTGKT